MKHAIPSPPSRRLLTQLLVVLLGMLAPISAPGQLPLPEAIPWASRQLEIPYRWTGSITGAVSVVLYYSADRGVTWQTAGNATPQVRTFRFNAPIDGEYWFCIRTYDASGRAAPGGPYTAEMRVVVDTAGPEVGDLSAELRDNRLDVSLSVSDTLGVDAESIRLYAQAEGHPGWLPVPILDRQPSADGRTLRLNARWVPPPQATRVEVRATVEDLAGNRAEQAAVATAQLEPARSLFAAKPAATSIWGRPPASGGTVDPFALAERNAPTRPAIEPRQPTTPPQATAWPTENRRTAPLLAGTDRASTSPFSSASFGATPSDPFERSRATRRETPSRLVNSTDFEFDYELEETGRWGVAKVELWGTENDGRSWRRFAIDSDRQSPIHVTTPGEGEYGFRLVVESVGGLQASTPRPGDAPEAIVGVDLQQPSATLRGARQGEGYFADQLIIEWNVDDEHLADRPIDLFYSSRESGPWIPVATNLPNSGRHTWRLQRHLPKRLHLRLEARDEAGNVGTATTPDPLVIEVPVASGSLQGVRAAGR